MMYSDIKRRLTLLEQEHGDPGVRIVTLAPGELEPEDRPGEILIIDDVSRLVSGAA
jgi:hypothetical protein